MELHNKNLKLLCRVCGQLLGKKHNFIGEVLKMKLENLFHVKLTDVDIIHPPNICQKCYCTLNNVLKRKTWTALSLCTQWKPHSDNCFTCQSVEKLSKGLIFSNVQSKNKAKCSGRPKDNTKRWTFSMFEIIREKIATLHDEEINIEELNNELNPHLQLCLCSICSSIPKQPLTLRKCEHLLCFFCIVENIKTKPISDTVCPLCKEHIVYEDLSTSKNTIFLIKMLTVACITFTQKFNIVQEYTIYKDHKSICPKKLFCHYQHHHNHHQQHHI
nr:V(D)J recombination-activating protein 1-like [Hydra vulgaris]